MMMQDFTKLSDVLNQNGVILCLSGIVSQGVIQEIGDALKERLQNEVDMLYYDIFSVFIEQTQNIIKYINKKAAGNQINTELSNSGMVCIQKMNNKYYVVSTNLVENSDVDELSERIEFIKNKNKDEIKKLYKKQIKKHVTDKTKGAGLGLLLMAKKASESLQYEIIKKNNMYQSFTLSVAI